MSVCRVPKTSLVDGIRCDVCEAKTPLTDSAGWMQVGTMDLCGPCGSEVVETARSRVAQKNPKPLDGGKSVRELMDALKTPPRDDLYGPGSRFPYEEIICNQPVGDHSASRIEKEEVHYEDCARVSGGPRCTCVLGEGKKTVTIKV